MKLDIAIMTNADEERSHWSGERRDVVVRRKTWPKDRVMIFEQVWENEPGIILKNYTDCNQHDLDGEYKLTMKDYLAEDWEGVVE